MPNPLNLNMRRVRPPISNEGIRMRPPCDTRSSRWCQRRPGSDSFSRLPIQRQDVPPTLSFCRVAKEEMGALVSSGRDYRQRSIEDRQADDLFFGHVGAMRLAFGSKKERARTIRNPGFLPIP